MASFVGFIALWIHLSQHSVYVPANNDFQGAFLAGGDVILPDYAAPKYGRVAKLLNWTVLENYANF